MAHKSRVVNVTAKDLEAWGIKQGSLQDMLDAFEGLDLPATEGGEPIFYDLTGMFEGARNDSLSRRGQVYGNRRRMTTLEAKCSLAGC